MCSFPLKPTYIVALAPLLMKHVDAPKSKWAWACIITSLLHLIMISAKKHGGGYEDRLFFVFHVSSINVFCLFTLLCVQCLLCLCFQCLLLIVFVFLVDLVFMVCCGCVFNVLYLFVFNCLLCSFVFKRLQCLLFLCLKCLLCLCFSMSFVFVSSMSLFATSCVLSVFNWLCPGCF